MFQVSSLYLKGCGSYSPDNIWMKKKKKKSDKNNTCMSPLEELSL